MSETAEILDRARAAKEVGIVAALALIQAGGDGSAALDILDDLRGVAEPESVEELDAVAIAAQAIAEARTMRGEA